MGNSRRIGLIGDLSLKAGIFYYEGVVRRFAAAGEGAARVVLAHGDLERVLALLDADDRPELGRYLASLANNLFDAGADLVAVAAVAPHLAIGEMRRHTRGLLVDVLDVIPGALSAAGVRRTAVFGSRAVIESNVYGNVPPEVAVTLPRSLVDEIGAVYASIASRGLRGTEAETRFLASAARRLIECDGVEVIVLAGTDLSSFYAEEPPTFAHLDVASLHVDQIMRLARSKCCAITT